MAIEDILKSCPIFFELYDKEIEKVVKKCEVKSFQAGDYIIRAGQNGREIYVLLEGSAKLQKDLPNGTVKYERFKRGEVFGVVVLLEKHTYTVDVVADTSCYVLEIPYDHIFSLYDSDPKIFGIICLNLSRLIAQRLSDLRGDIFSLKNELAKYKKVG